jgi:hypothetical protein
MGWKWDGLDLYSREIWPVDVFSFFISCDDKIKNTKY